MKSKKFMKTLTKLEKTSEKAVVNIQLTENQLNEIYFDII